MSAVAVLLVLGAAAVGAAMLGGGQGSNGDGPAKPPPRKWSDVGGMPLAPLGPTLAGDFSVTASIVTMPAGVRACEVTILVQCVTGTPMHAALRAVVVRGKDGRIHLTQMNGVPSPPGVPVQGPNWLLDGVRVGKQFYPPHGVGPVMGTAYGVRVLPRDGVVMLQLMTARDWQQHMTVQWSAREL